MVSRSHYKQDGYQKGFVEGKRTGGKVKKAYLDNFFKHETQGLSTEDSSEFTDGWHEGFSDAVIGVLNKMVKKDGLLKNKVGK